ncbi:MAG: group 1 glycosyl transferase, partial [Paraglaciecola sp.]|nr:group 1 glycosyl transferase [Paraglaciecola sp.]
MKKIVILSHRVPFPPNKGEKIRTFHQLKHLSEHGHQIHLFAPSEDKEENDYFEQLKNGYCTSVETRYLATKPLRLLTGLIKNKPLSVANFYSAALQQQFDEFIQSQNVDAILCTASSMAEYVFNSLTLSSLSKKPILLMDFMDVDSDKWAQYARNSSYP